METTSRQVRREDEVTLLDYWRVMRKHGLMILGITCVSVVAAGFTSYFLMTKIYESRATILAPKESGGGGGGGSLLAALAASGGRQVFGDILPSMNTNRDAFIAILKSRTMAQELVDKFNLKDYFKAQFTIDAIRALERGSDIRVSKEGVISVTVEDKDPKLAADVANAYITNLDRLFAKMGTTDASRQRAFIAERLDKTEKSLRQAEEVLRRFQESNKAVVMQEQSKSAIEETAKLRAQIVTAEGQLEFTRTYSTENNPQVLQQRRQIDELKRQLGQMQFGHGMDLPPESLNSGQPRRELHLPFTKVPEMEMELIRLTRDVKVQEGVYSLLTSQFEQAKIAEARDMPSVQILDRAVPAERKSKPITVLNMAIAGTVSLFVGILLAFFLEYVGDIKKREGWQEVK